MLIDIERYVNYYNDGISTKIVKHMIEKTRKDFEKSYFTISELAEVMGISRKSVKTHLKKYTEMDLVIDYKNGREKEFCLNLLWK